MTTFKSPFRSPLYWRLLIWFCAANLLVFFLGSALTRSFINYSTEQEVDWPVLAQAADQAYETGGPNGLDEWARQQREDGIEATLFENGQALREIRLPASVRESLPTYLSAGRDILLKPWPGHYIAVQQVIGTDGQTRQMVAVSSARGRVPLHTRQNIFLVVQLVLSLLLIGVAGWWVARSVSRPVEALRSATHQMASGKFSTRLSSRWSSAHDELGQLARDFNGMAERIETLVAHDRVVLQDLSHELRSPLARLHLILDLAQHSADPSDAAAHFRRAEREIERLDRMTAEMLALSRLEGGLPGMERERVELAALIVGRVDAAEVEAEARDVRILFKPSKPVTVSGSQMLLERAIDNLLINAIKFSRIGGVVEITLETVQHVAELSVRDHGPGVPEQELSELFRPFFRGTNAAHAEGHGLGLAIVHRVAHVHEGHVFARNAEGEGLELRLQLPWAAADSTVT
jgi:two-component system, OmpR family, sensor kinase